MSTRVPSIAIGIVSIVWESWSWVLGSWAVVSSMLFNISCENININIVVDRCRGPPCAVHARTGARTRVRVSRVCMLPLLGWGWGLGSMEVAVAGAGVVCFSAGIHGIAILQY